jgi:hypothetical protein
MKHFILVGIFLIMTGCSGTNKSEWDSGGNAQRAFSEEARQEEEEAVRSQLPTASPL